MCDIIKENYQNDTGIVYFATIADAVKYSWEMSDQGISTAYYHGQMLECERKYILNRWMNGSIKVVCATQAFGMGINKSNVRFICHYNMPSSLISYVQEIGRAGRDGAQSEVIFFFNMEDYYK